MDLTERKITKIAREASKLAVRTLKEDGIGTAEYDFIHLVRHHPGITQAEVREQLRVDKGAAARRAASLEAKGYLIRQANPKDGRSQLLFATEKAEGLRNSKAQVETTFYEWLLAELPEAEKITLAARLHARIEQLRTQPPQPVLLEKDGRPWDFTCLPVTQYGDFVRQEAFDSFSRLLDRFYAARDRADAIRQSSQVIRKTVSNLQARTARKLENQRKELAATHDRERLRRLGDILTANLYAVKRGQTKLCAADFYDPEMKEIEIPLNPAISPQQNAAKFYKDYQKAKTAEKVLTEQIARGEQELAYLASVLDALTRAESVRDLQEIRAELVSGGYLRQTDRKKQMKLPPSRPMRFVSSDGFGIWVGLSNRQNDELTTKLAAKTDIWLHVQKIPGSHVIIETGGQTPPDRTVTEAMQLAAYYSQARAGQNVPVDYTPVKYVKKPAGARPGMVIYTTYQTAVVTPDAALCEALKEKN